LTGVQFTQYHHHIQSQTGVQLTQYQHHIQSQTLAHYAHSQLDALAPH